MYVRCAVSCTALIVFTVAVDAVSPIVGIVLTMSINVTNVCPTMGYPPLLMHLYLHLCMHLLHHQYHASHAHNLASTVPPLITEIAHPANKDTIIKTTHVSHVHQTATTAITLRCV